MKDRLRTLSDIGTAIREARKSAQLTTVDVAAKSGRSRDILNRLERGEDVSLSSLLAILAAIGHSIEIVPTGPPTLAEMARRFAQGQDDE
jgi:HTH-type transcriptional regulator/antitoxin HipB